jgi:hypothetical protein
MKYIMRLSRLIVIESVKITKTNVYVCWTEAHTVCVFLFSIYQTQTHPGCQINSITSIHLERAVCVTRDQHKIFGYFIVLLH